MAKTGDSPPECHGEPKIWHADSRMKTGGWWECVVRKRAAERRRYEELDGVTYNHLLLKHRRQKALARRRQREASRG